MESDMLQEESIQKSVSEQSWKRGHKLYRAGSVQDMQITDLLKDRKTYHQITATVQGSTGKVYRMMSVIDMEKASVLSYHCDCSSNSRNGEFCSHCVAALLRYIHVQNMIWDRQKNPTEKIIVELPEHIEKKVQSEEKESIFSTHSNTVQIRPVRPTAPGMLDILIDHAKSRRKFYLEKGIRGKVIVEPFVFIHEKELYLTLKIGITRKYILSDLEDFCECVISGDYRSYGKQLAFTHQMSAFTEESRAVVLFLIRQYRNNQERKKDSFLLSENPYKSRDVFNKYMHLTGNFLDDFISLMEKRTFEAEIDKEEGRIYYRVENREPLCRLRIEGVSGGVMLHTVTYQIFTGSSFQYIFRAGTVYKISLESVQHIQKFRNYMNQRGKEGCFITKADLPLFCRDMLPELRKHYRMEEILFDPEEYLPEEASFEIYLDLQDGRIMTCSLIAKYGDRKYEVFSEESLQEQRDLEKEAETAGTIREYFPVISATEKTAQADMNEEQLYEFLTDGVEELSQYGEIFISDSLKNIRMIHTAKCQLSVGIKGNFLELKIASDEISLEEIREILQKYNSKKQYHRLKSGTFVKIEKEEIGQMIQMLDNLQISPAALKNESITIPKYRAPYIDQMFRDDILSDFSRSKEFRLLTRNLNSVEESEYEVPEQLREIMREYQKKGYRWLETLSHSGFGGILADDMGLGKTLQVIAFLLAEQTTLKDTDKNRRTLIVCPSSLVYNWQNEIRKFAPSLQVLLIVGSAQVRSQLILESKEQEILITSYDLLKRDVVEYANLDFFCEIIDEAQYIKNKSTQAARAVKEISANTRFALTGTPIENRLSELWSIFDFLMPDFLFSYQHFRDQIEVPIAEKKDQKALKRLHDTISPFVLRRLKQNVLKDLPDKMEEVVYAQLEGDQKELYWAHAKRLQIMISGQSEEEFRGSKIRILAELTKLRQICCAPSLLYDNFTEVPIKVAMCMDLITDAVDGGHKILVFSQFTSMLALLTKAAGESGIPFFLLTGETGKEERMEMVDLFQTDDTPVFFISLKAGGTGLNLTKADIVIHFDPWWNVAAQNQATDRTHRIGQKNVVTVYQLIAKDTIEEKILELQEKKKELADQILQNESFSNSAFHKEELLKLLEQE